MSIAPLLREISEAGCSVLVEGERIEMLGRFPDDLLMRVKARKGCIGSVLKGAMVAGMGPMFGPDELDELAGEVETEDREILERRWVVVRPWDYPDWRSRKNRPEDRPCCVSVDSEGSGPMTNTSDVDGPYGDAVGSGSEDALWQG